MLLRNGLSTVCAKLAVHPQSGHAQRERPACNDEQDMNGVIVNPTGL
jgi:hypothetical protein